MIKYILHEIKTSREYHLACGQAGLPEQQFLKTGRNSGGERGGDARGTRRRDLGFDARFLQGIL